MNTDLWPITIHQTRYQGAYEGGSWVAASGADLPPVAFGSDVPCSLWWENRPAIGRGQTPDEALADLEARYLSHGEPEHFSWDFNPDDPVYTS